MCSETAGRVHVYNYKVKRAVSMKMSIKGFKKCSTAADFKRQTTVSYRKEVE